MERGDVVVIVVWRVLANTPSQPWSPFVLILMLILMLVLIFIDMVGSGIDLQVSSGMGSLEVVGRE